MSTRAFRTLGAGSLVLAGFWLAPVAAQAVEGAGRVRSATIRAVSPQQAKLGRRKPRVAAVPAEAKKAESARAEPESPADSTGAVATTWTMAEPAERACFKARRKLWQDGEGWVVKSVRVCP